MKTLCVYTTRTGLTKQIMEQIAAQTDADILYITDGRDQSGVMGYIRAAMIGLKKSLPQLLPFEAKLPLDSYDRVIVGAPIWCENICPIARSFLKTNGGLLKGEVAYVITHMSNIPYEKQIAALDNLIGKKPGAVLSVQTHKHDWQEEVRSFVQKLN